MVITKVAKNLALNHFQEFLNEHRTTNEFNTHNSCANPKGKFNIPGSALEHFYEIYWDLINSEQGVDFYFTERSPVDFCPIKIDIDLEIKRELEAEGKIKLDETTKHYYSLRTIKKLIYTILQELRNIIDFSKLEAKKQIVVVTEKEKPTIKKCETLISDGFHILFPYLVTSSDVQFYIREKILKQEVFDSIFSGISFCNEPDKVYDKQIINGNWTLYGSRGKLGGSVYVVTHILQFPKGDQDTFKELRVQDLESGCLPKVFSIRNKDIVCKFKTPEIKREVEEYYYHKYEKRKRKNKKKVEYSQGEVELARKLVKILSPRRAVSYEDWIRVCWCLRNIDDKLLLEDFLEFSQLCAEKYNESECIQVWEAQSSSQTADGLLIGTLHYWAKEDNPAEYREIINNDITRITDDLPDTHIGIAKLVWLMYKHEFVCVYPTSNNKKWYHFENHIWRPNAQTLLTKRISEDLLDLFNKIKDKFYRNSQNMESPSDRDNFTIKHRKAIKVCSQLGNMPFIENIVKACGIQFQDDTFEDKLDIKNHLLVFENGVYDLETFTFRDGFPDDYCSLSTGINYIPYNSPENKYIKEVQRFIEGMLPNKNVREYTYYVLSQALQGTCDTERFYLFTGSGGNGKSLLLKLLQESLGTYAVTASITMITQGRNKSSAASPDILAIRNKRLVLFQEPDKQNENSLNVGFIKELTGGDKIVARNLFEKNIVSFVANSVFILTCNDPPIPSSHDDGWTRRIRVIQFLVKFVENPVEEDEKQMDPMLRKEYLKWKETFITILIEKYKYLKTKLKGKIPEPPEVTEFTDQYNEQTNINLQFIRETVKADPEKKSTISTTILYQKFRIWFMTNYPGIKIPQKSLLVDFLKSKYKKDFTKMHGLKGYTIVDPEVVEFDLDTKEEKITIE